MRIRLPGWLGWAIAVAGLALLLLVVLTADVPGESLSFTPGLVAGLLAAQTAVLIPESLRMQVVLQRAAGMRFGMLFMLRVFVLSRILNLVVPQSGTVFRIAEINSRYGARITETTGGMVAFVWISTVANLAAAAVIEFVAGDDAAGPWPALAAVAVTAAIAPFVVVLLVGRLSSGRPIVDRLGRLARSVIAVVRDGRVIARFAVLWMATVGLVVAVYASGFAIAGDVPPIALMIVLYTLVQASSFVVLTPGNLGIQELGFVGIAVLFGVDAGVAAAAALVIRVSGMAVTALAAVPLSTVK